MKALTQQAVIKCPHGGVASLQGLRGSKVGKAASIPLITEKDVGLVPLTCPKPTPCTSVTSWEANQDTVWIDGARLLTKDSIPVTDGGEGTVVSEGQQIINVK